MTALVRLGLTALRNIDSLNMRPGAGVNVLFGENGSGKTSVLEGIHLLGMGRSFRSHQVRPLIQEGREECTVFGELDDGSSLGITKSGRNAQTIRINNRNAANTAELAHALPIQVMNSDTFSILEGGPGVRRRFLDWGVFHVEHGFLDHWRHVQRALQNRNSLLKASAPAEALEPWTRELVRHGEKLQGSRQAYVASFLPVLEEVLSELGEVGRISLEYERGWDADQDLRTVLARTSDRDYRYGFTSAGPHRADLKVKVGTRDAAEILSRGQQKLLIAALKLAQGRLLEREKGRRCIYLVDDLPAELDRGNRALLCSILDRMECQAFITCVEREALEGCLPKGQAGRWFHVKHGKITTCPD